MASVICAAFPVAAQQRATAAKSTKTIATKDAPTQTQPTAKCNGGWSGIVTFTKTLKEEASKKETNRIKETTYLIKSRDYDYAARYL